MAHFKSTSLADQIFDKLENDIVFGAYARGEILTEMMLAEQLGVSRTPIREALHRLAQERLIEDTGKGMVVIGITREDLRDIMDIRLRIEGLAAYYAAQNITPEGIAELQHVLDLQDFYYSKSDLNHIRLMDDSFHALLCKYSGRGVLEDTLLPLHRKTQRYRRASISDPERILQVPVEHRQIFNAIVAGDADLAEKLTMEHIQNAKKNMLERIKDDGIDDCTENH